MKLISEKRSERNVRRLKSRIGWVYFYYPWIYSLIFCVLAYFYLEFGLGGYLVSNHPEVINLFKAIFPATEWLSNNSPRFREQLIPIGFFMRVLFIVVIVRVLYLHFKYRKLFYYYALPMTGHYDKGTGKELLKLLWLFIMVTFLFIVFVYMIFFWGSEVFLLEHQLDNYSRNYLWRDDIMFNTALGFIHIFFITLVATFSVFYAVLMCLELINKFFLMRKASLIKE